MKHGAYHGDRNDPASFCVVCGRHPVYLMMVTELLERQGQILEGQSAFTFLNKLRLCALSPPLPSLLPPTQATVGVLQGLHFIPFRASASVSTVVQ